MVITPSKILMGVSALFMLGVSMVLIFAPDETIRALGGAQNTIVALVFQATGALYLGFAVLNWMAKDNLIGGIYSRPVALGNFSHFFVIAVTLLKTYIAGLRSSRVLVAAVIYLVFAAWFGSVTFGSPKLKHQP